MLGPIDYGLWFVSFILEALVVICSIRSKSFISYLSLNLYMMAAALVTLGQYILIQRYGFQSMNYRYYYYYSESLLTVFLYFAITELYQHLLGEMKAGRYVRLMTLLLLSGTALFSYMVVRQNKENLTGHFVVQLEQNLYFVGGVLTYLLWGAILKLRENRVRLVQLVLALGIYLSATAGAYALRHLFPSLQTSLLRWVPPVIGTWLPLAWAYTFYKVPEEARMATARLVARTR